MWNSLPWQAWNAMRYWTKISKDEKGWHSNTSQGNPKDCSLEKQAGCVHSDKRAGSPCWRKFHRWIWPGYQTSCSRLHCIHRVCRQVRQNGQQLWNCSQNMEVDQETIFSPNRHDHSKRISYTQVMWWQVDSQKFPEVHVVNWLSIHMKKMWQLVAFQGADQVHLLPFDLIGNKCSSYAH